MTRQTSSQVNKTYRQRKAEKAAQMAQTLERYRGALERIADGSKALTAFYARDLALQALTTSHEMEGK